MHHNVMFPSTMQCFLAKSLQVQDVLQENLFLRDVTHQQHSELQIMQQRFSHLFGQGKRRSNAMLVHGIEASGCWGMYHITETFPENC